MDDLDDDYLKGTPWPANMSELAGAAALAGLVVVLVLRLASGA